jgi:hypothetical protein
MALADLSQLAVQVHTFMARAIQPFSTYGDGDTLFAASTQEIGGEAQKPGLGALDFIAAETMWDAILASVPEEPEAPEPAPGIALPAERLACFIGRYRMGPGAEIEIALRGSGLTARLQRREFLDLHATPSALHAMSDREFRIDSRYGTRLAFETGPNCKAGALAVNPGPWVQRGVRLPD